MPRGAAEQGLAGGRVRRRPDADRRREERVMPSIVRKLFGGVDDVAAELVRLRAQVERTQAEIAAEQARPVPLAELGARIGATISGLRSEAERLVPAGELVRAEGGPLAG